MEELKAPKLNWYWESRWEHASTKKAEKEWESAERWKLKLAECVSCAHESAGTTLTPCATEADDEGDEDDEDDDEAQHANSVVPERRGWRGANAGSSKSSESAS